jgi:hypothetical protein
LPFKGDSFSGAVAFTMFHHVLSVELQNKLIREICRVIRPVEFLTARNAPEAYKVLRPAAVRRVFLNGPPAGRLRNVFANLQFIIGHFRVYSCGIALAATRPAVCDEVWLNKCPNVSEDSHAP